MELRKVEIYREDKWVEIIFKDLKVGDTFRMFEPGGARVEGLDYFAGTNEWVCTKGPYLNAEGVWTVDSSLAKDLEEYK